MSQLPDDLVEFMPMPGSGANPVDGETLKVVKIKTDATSKKLLAKRAHDVTSALRTLRFAMESMQAGYRFDDEMAAAKLASMDRAVGALERECQLLYKIFDPSNATSG